MQISVRPSRLSLWSAAQTAVERGSHRQVNYTHVGARRAPRDQPRRSRWPELALCTCCFCLRRSARGGTTGAHCATQLPPSPGYHSCAALSLVYIHTCARARECYSSAAAARCTIGPFHPPSGHRALARSCISISVRVPAAPPAFSSLSRYIRYMHNCAAY